MKKYLSSKLEVLQVKEKAADAYLKKYKNINKIQNSNEMLQKDSRYYQFLKDQISPLSQELNIWVNESYNKSTYKPERLICKSKSGNMLRSKSEVFIDDALFSHGIPYRYECALDLGGHIIYPDFTIRHPKTGEVYYWEHCGKMDDESYVKRFCEKIEEYTRNGIIPSVNLILTYETAEHPLDPGMVDKIIEYYFC